MNRWATPAIGLLIFGFTAFVHSTTAFAQSGPGWITLFNGKTLGDWDRTNETNWRVEGGAIVADKKPAKGTAHLVSKKKFKDFQLYVEF